VTAPPGSRDARQESDTLPPVALVTVTADGVLGAFLSVAPAGCANAAATAKTAAARHVWRSLRVVGANFHTATSPFD
jgi:hypothetical protein